MGGVLRGAQRIIPARAGFTRCAGLADLLAGDHPRSRGVYTDQLTVTGNASGSSPLARGLPAPPRPAQPPAPDHPRSRGVYGPYSPSTTSVGGSSPLARGLPSLSSFCVRAVRIIPARAGFTVRHSPTSCQDADHPRSRGVYRHGWLHPGEKGGSSPLARGLLAAGGKANPDMRIIPARAGFTSQLRPRPWTTGDHPRSRGVYFRALMATIARTGSSPLARGLRRLGDGPDQGLRIIPARAGFTYGRYGRSTYTYGSSPLARGLRVALAAQPHHVRIIPARAGFTLSPRPRRGG